MNGQDKIIEQILLDASTYANQLQERAEGEFTDLCDAATKRAEDLVCEEAKKQEKERQDQLARTKVLATLDGKKQILSAKKRAIDDVFSRALEMLNNLDKPAYMVLSTDYLMSTHRKTPPFCLQKTHRLQKGILTLYQQLKLKA